MDGQKGSKVKRRKVFYIPGYDPIHPRRYRELYRSEGAEQAQILGYDLRLSAKPSKEGRYGWRVAAVIDGTATKTEVEVLVWSDIVRGSMETGVLGTYRQLFSTAWTYIGSGTLWRLMRLRAGPVIAALYPIVFLLAQLAIAIAMLFFTWWLMFQAFAMITAAIVGPFLFGPFFVVRIFIALAFGIGAAGLTLHLFRKHDNRFYAYYLMHDYAYSAQSKGAIPDDLEGRMAEFTEVIAAALKEDLDEVLLVGHSSGAHLGVSILSDLIRASGVPADGPALSFLSLGHVVPMVSFLPDAWRLRQDLQFLGTSDALTWVDVTAPADGCAFALCHPVNVTGVAAGATHAPLVVSAAFSQTLSAEKWASLKRRYFRIHFQYLCAFDRPGDYDYFQITGGPVTLADRYKDRRPSPSMIDTPTSKFRSTAP
ncbi:MAG: hypothetical protein ACPG5U_05065 [Planktomarina sp.]